jgi:hypothetical protein
MSQNGIVVGAAVCCQAERSHGLGELQESEGNKNIGLEKQGNKRNGG